MSALGSERIWRSLAILDRGSLNSGGLHTENGQGFISLLFKLMWLNQGQEHWANDIGARSAISNECANECVYGLL